MVDPQKAFEEIVRVLDAVSAEYLLFTHRPILSYEDAAAVQQEAGYVGTEGKCMVMRADDRFVVYMTLQGKKTDMGKVKERTAAKKVSLATGEELQEYFGAQPGCAYPFGFSSDVEIFLDPSVFQEEWVLFSPALPTMTAQVRGKDLQRSFLSLANKVSEAPEFVKVSV